MVYNIQEDEIKTGAEAGDHWPIRLWTCVTGVNQLWNITFHLGLVHPLQDVALHQCLPLSSVCCFPVPGGSLLPCYVVLPPSAWSSFSSLPCPWLPLCAAFGPPLVLHSCSVSGLFSLLFQCVFYNFCSFPDFFSIVSYLVALDSTFFSPLLFEWFSVCQLLIL